MIGPVVAALASDAIVGREVFQEFERGFRIFFADGRGDFGSGEGGAAFGFQVSDDFGLKAQDGGGGLFASFNARLMIGVYVD